jgi:hypothetical protein
VGAFVSSHQGGREETFSAKDLQSPAFSIKLQTDPAPFWTKAVLSPQPSKFNCKRTSYGLDERNSQSEWLEAWSRGFQISCIEQKVVCVSRQSAFRRFKKDVFICLTPWNVIHSFVQNVHTQAIKLGGKVFGVSSSTPHLPILGLSTGMPSHLSKWEGFSECAIRFQGMSIEEPHRGGLKQ